MKKNIVLIWVLLVCFSFQLKAQDGVFSSAQATRPNQFSFGVQPIIYTQLSNDEFMMLFRGVYEFQSGLSLHGKVGLLKEETYFGAHFEYMLASEPIDPLSFAVIAGVYSFGDVGLKLGGVLGKQVGEFSVYTGLTAEPLFGNSELFPLLIPIGLDIPVGDQAHFIFEIDLGLNDDSDAYEALHFGVNLFF